jgi:hypothetical protein
LGKEIAAGILVGERDGKCWSIMVAEFKEMGCGIVNRNNLIRDRKKLCIPRL